MKRALAISRHELVSLRREKLPQVLLMVFIFMVSVSGLIGWLTNTTVSSVWTEATQAGLTQAPNPFENVSPLYYSRNTVIYLVLIGALMAIVVGVTSTMRDRKARTIDLVLSRPISVVEYLLGKTIGVAIFLAAALVATGLISWVSISFIVGKPLGFQDTARLMGFFGIALIFLMAFVLLGMISGVYASRETTALLIPISLWSITAFVLPQIGTSANPVSLLNPVPKVSVPGGAFDALNTILGPLSVTEQFKGASGWLLSNPEATGDFTTSIFVVVIAASLGMLTLLLTRRDRIRGALND